jgi:tRNA(Ile)-lysidine synthase
MSRTRRKQEDSSKKDGSSRTSSSKFSADALLERVCAAIVNHRMIAPGDRLLVAISGGPDSTALLHLLVQLRGRLGCRLRACHVHHGLRGEEADADAEQGAALARSLRVPFVVHRADVRSFARSQKMSLEAAARAVRYRLLEFTAEQTRANRIATGHTADDQAETVLLNLLRGAGPGGLAGIPPVRGKIIRPLLWVARAETEQYCKEEKLSYRIDSSNLDTRFARNRIRHEILPALRKVQPRVDGALARLAEIMREEDAYVSGQAAQALREMGAERPGEVGIACTPFAGLTRALQRRVVRAAIAKLKGDELDIELERVDALAGLAVSGRTGAVVELPGGVRGERTYGELMISATPEKAPPPTGEWTLQVPGRVKIAGLGVEITAARSRARRPPAKPSAALFDAKAVTLPLTVRTRRRGDRFRPLGMRQSVKLQDFFVNTKVPRADRDRVPLVLSDDEIVWVVGHRTSERCKVTGRTRSTIRLEVRRLT